MELSNLTNAPISFGVVGDHILYRKGLVKIVESFNKEFSVLFEAGTKSEFIQSTRNLKMPDIVIISIKMSNIEGFTLIEWLNEEYQNLPLIVITTSEDSYVLKKMSNIHIEGIVHKHTTPNDLENIVKDVLANRICHTNPNNSKQEAHTKFEQFEKLETKEQKFLELACEELTIEQIADIMNLSPKTVEGYRLKVYEKFHIHSRIGLIRHALKYRLVGLK